MNLRYVFLTNIASLAVLIGFGIWGSLISTAQADAALHSGSIRFIIWGLFWGFFGSLFWLYVQSWVMVFKGWKRRANKENTNLFLILVVFNIPASYWFYSRRYAIDPAAP